MFFCQPSKTGVGVVARYDIHARVRGSPVTTLNQQRFQCTITACGMGVFQLLETDRFFAFDRASRTLCITAFARSIEQSIRLAKGDARDPGKLYIGEESSSRCYDCAIYYTS